MRRTSVTDKELRLADGRPMLLKMTPPPIVWRGPAEDIAVDGLRVATEVTSCPSHLHSKDI
jgi:hypothetical protein